MTNNKQNNRFGGSAVPAIIAAASAVIIILLLLGFGPQSWFKNLFGGSDKLAFIGSFGDFKNPGTIDDAAQTIVRDLVSAQTNARTENVKWGICFRNPAGGSDFYDVVSNILVFPDDACTIGGSIIHKSNINLPVGIDFLLPSQGKFISVVFNVNGTTNSSSDIILQISNGREYRYIIITPLGFITYGLTTSTTTVVAPAPTTTSTRTTVTTTNVVNRTLVVKPSAPFNVSAINLNGSVTLSWNAPTFNGNAPIGQYRVYRSYVSNGERIFVGSTAGNNTAFTDTGLVNGTNYFYRVTAVNFLFESQESNEVVGSPRGPVVIVTPPVVVASESAPSAPRNLDADGGRREIFLSWNTPSSNGGATITNYRVYRATSSGNTPDYLATVSGSTTSYTNTGLSDNRTYYYWVRAVNSAGEGNFSNQASATTDPAQNTTSNDTVPSAPRSLQAQGGQNQVFLSWNSPSSNGGANITSYRVYRLNSSGSPVQITSTSNTSYTDGSRSDNTTYSYRVSAVNSVGEGAYSQASATTFGSQQQTQAPDSPTNLQAYAGQNQISLSWNSPSNNGGATVTSYRIYSSTSNGNPSYLTTVNGTTSYAHAGLPNSATYYYWVKAVNSVGESANYSNQASATTYPAQQCPSGQTGTYPNCTAPQCPSGYTGTYPNCTAPQCPSGYTGTYPNCTAPQCPSGYTGTYPNCVQQTQAPHIVNQPQDQTVNEGQDVTFWVAISDGNTPRTYQWRRNGANIPGATSFSYTLRATAADNGALFSVVVSNSAGSDTSRNARLTVISQPSAQVPSAPLNLVATPGNGHVALSWNAPSSNGGSNITQYKIYRSAGNGSQYYIFQVSGNSTYWDDTDLSAGTTYTYQVSAVNSVGEGPKSNYASGTTAPGVPQGVSVYRSGNSITISWYGSAGATSYRVRRGTSPNNPTTTFTTSNLSFTDSGLNYNTTYYYSVAAVNSAGSSNYSAETWTTTDNAPQTQQCPSGYTGTYPNCTAPQCPSGYTGTYPNCYAPQQGSAPATPQGSNIYSTGNNVHFAWYRSSGATSYIVRRGTSQNTPTQYFQLGDVASFNDSGLNYNTTYYYSVSAVNSYGQSSYTVESWTTTGLQ